MKSVLEFRTRIYFFGILLLVRAISPVLDAAMVADPWVPIFKGVERAGGTADQQEPVLQQVKAIRIDLHDPDIAFFSTPVNEAGDLDTLSQSTSDFLWENGLQIGINANFFSPCCSDTPEAKDLTGVAISEGELVSAPETSGAGARALLITANNVASIATTSGTFNANNYWTAIAGSDAVLLNGTVQTNFPAIDLYTNAHSRSAVGVSQDGRYLILMTIDGRQPGYSVGGTVADAGRWLLRFGAYHGINLGGGFASALVMDNDGEPLELNRPSGGVEQLVGNNFGVWALPLPLTIIEAPQSQTVFIRQNATLSVNATGPPPIYYQWQFNGTNIAGATGKTIAITNAEPDDTGDYSVVVSNPDETNVLTAHITVTDEVIVTAVDVNLLGNWIPTSAGAGQYSESFFYVPATAGASATAEATFRPNIPVAGPWDVYIWYSSGTGRSTNVPVLVAYQGGVKSTNINEAVNGGDWVLLDSRLNFGQGTGGFVKIANNTGESNRYIIADAARFRFRPDPPSLVRLSGTGFTNGTLRILLNGETGVKHIVERSTNLVDWETATNFTMPDGGFQFMESPAPGIPRRFYRTKAAP